MSTVKTIRFRKRPLLVGLCGLVAAIAGAWLLATLLAVEPEEVVVDDRNAAEKQTVRYPETTIYLEVEPQTSLVVQARAEGMAVPGAVVRLVASETRLQGYTDEEGVWWIHLPAGREYRALVVSGDLSGDASVNIIEGVNHLTIDLQPGRNVAVKFLDDAGRAIIGLPFGITDLKFHSDRSVTSEIGRADFVVPSWVREVRVSLDRGTQSGTIGTEFTGASIRSAGEPWSVTSGDIKEIVLERISGSRAPGEIKFTLITPRPDLDELEYIVAGEHVSWSMPSSVDPEVVINWRVTLPGSVATVAAPAGVYRVRVALKDSVRGTRFGASIPEFTVRGGATTDVRVHLVTLADLSLVLTKPDGSPVTRGAVIVDGLISQARYVSQTGRVTFPSLPIGERRLTLLHSRFGTSYGHWSPGDFCILATNNEAIVNHGGEGKEVTLECIECQPQVVIHVSGGAGGLQLIANGQSTGTPPVEELESGWRLYCLRPGERYLLMVTKKGPVPMGVPRILFTIPDWTTTTHIDYIDGELKIRE